MIIVGITGVMGSGKSTVSALLEQRGFPVLDLDKMAKTVAASREVTEEIAVAFGPEYISSGTVHTEKMQELVFTEENALKKLEDIIHPRVRQRLQNEIKKHAESGAKTVIVDAPLLYETGLYKEVDKVVVVSADAKKIRTRLMQRGMNKDDIERRLCLQIPLEEKERRAHYVIKNNGTTKCLEKEVATLVAKIQSWEEQ